MNNDPNAHSNSLNGNGRILGAGRYNNGNLVSYATIHDINAIRLAVALPIAAGCFVVYWLSGFIEKYASFAFPYNIIAGFYHYLFNLPVQSIGLVWRWLDLLRLTPYSNLNLIFSCIGIAFYTLFVISIYVYIAKTITEKFNEDGNFLSLSVGPAIIALLWFIASVILAWIF